MYLTALIERDPWWFCWLFWNVMYKVEGKWSDYSDILKYEAENHWKK